MGNHPDGPGLSSNTLSQPGSNMTSYLDQSSIFISNWIPAYFVRSTSTSHIKKEPQPSQPVNFTWLSSTHSTVPPAPSTYQSLNCTSGSFTTRTLLAVISRVVLPLNFTLFAA